MTYGELYKQFCEWSSKHAAMAIDYRPWGTNSIVVWLNNKQAYKVKYHVPNKFTMQMLSEEDIKRKFGLMYAHAERSGKSRMKVVNAGYKILTEISEGGIKELQHIEKIGRVCYKSEGLITEDGESAKKFIKKLISNGHEAMLEHSSLSVLFTVDRGVTHELVRHRIMSFAQESTRYCNYSGDKFGNEITVIKPCFFEEGTNEYMLWWAACHEAERYYMDMVKEMKIPSQQARSVLPTSTKADITLTGNYREWRHFFKLRACGVTGAPHPQMLEVTIPLLGEVSELIPVVFDDLAWDSGSDIGRV